MKIVIDAMGGDNAPYAIVKGACRAARECDVEIILTGDKEKISPLVENNQNIEIVHTTEEITCFDDPTSAVKSKKDSSMVKGLTMVKNNEADGFISAGSTGALISAATLYVRRMKGVRRMALAPVLPFNGYNLLLMDSGANMDCTAEFLLQFAVMGSIYMKSVLNIDRPRVGLLNVGVEETKGDTLTKEAYSLLKDAPINFIGNIESREVLNDVADVIVCDGFAGNVLLKGIEGVLGFFGKEIKLMFTKNMRTKMAAVMLSKELGEFKKKLKPEDVGGAPMLGANGLVIKMHGNAVEEDVYNAVRQAMEFVKKDVNSEIKKYLD